MTISRSKTRRRTSTKQHPEYWSNTGETTRMWNLISERRITELKAWIEEDVNVVHIRSEDGRGPLWWAYEKGNMKIVNLLLSSGVDGTLKDSTGAMAKEMRQN